MRIDKKKASTLFALTLLIVALVAINLNVPAGVASPEEPIYLHGPPLQPIHMNSNITLTPVHMHSKQGIINLYDNPICTDWHELHPNNCTDWHLSSWNDTGEPFQQFSPNDQIDMTYTLPDGTEQIKWFHVDRITYTLNLSSFPEPTERMFIEFKGPPGIDEPLWHPNCTYWHEVYPSYSNVYHLLGTSGLPIEPCTDINLNMTKGPTPGLITTWHVDDVATDLILREKIMDPICTWWHAIYPPDEYCNWYHITSWESYPDEYCDRLSPCDQIDMDNSTSEQWDEFWSMGDVNRDGYIEQADWDLISQWNGSSVPPAPPECDLDGDDFVDDNDLTILEGNLGKDIWTYFGLEKKWYHVDRVTVTLNVTDDPVHPTKWMKIELKTVEFEEIYEVFKYPLGSRWHEVYPNYCNVYNLTEWHWDLDDNCNGVLDPCDWIWLLNMTSGDPAVLPERWHIEDMTYDLILNEKISDPVTDWQELYPNYDTLHHIDDWIDTQLEGEVGYGILSPCDNITMGPEEYHVENVTLTMEVYSEIEGTFYIELNATFEDIYRAKTEPVSTWWYNVYPYFEFDEWYHLSNWTDNCNGVLDHCDNITLEDPQIGWSADFHVEELAIDIVVKKTAAPPPPPPPPMYWKENYTDYAPSGVPDFNQRQDLWNQTTGMWTWCVPTAVANSLWWTDSRFDFHPNGSRLLTNYTAGIDDHDPQNVQPFIQHLAYLMDTDNQRTGIPHAGTLVTDTQAGIAQYLSWTGVNPLGDVNGDGIVNQTDWHHVNAVRNASKPFDISADIWPVTLGWPTPGIADNVVNMSDLWLVGNHTGETGMFYEKTVQGPDFVEDVEDEVLRCEDVILGLNFYDQYWEKTTDPLKKLGHAVTVAGVNSTSQPPRIAISDPDEDNAEPPPQGTSGPGRVLPQGVTHAHNATPPHTLHNNASYVSHDIYNVTPIAPPPPINASWALANYPAPPGTVAVVEWAVIVSPLPVEEEVCSVNITNVVPSFSEAYPTWGEPYYEIYVNVTVMNNGTVPLNCTVAAYYNASTWYEIGTENVTNLNVGNETTVTINWTLSDVPDNVTHTIKANATCPCDAHDELINGQVKIRLWGDVNDNGQVQGDWLDTKKVKLGRDGYLDISEVPFTDMNGNGFVFTDWLDFKKSKLLRDGYI